MIAGMDEATQKMMKGEVLPFLHPSARKDVKSVALSFFLGLTGKPEGVTLIKKNPDFLEAIVSLTSDDAQDIVKDAFRSLVNLTADEEISWLLLNMKRYPTICLSMLKYLVNRESEFADLAGAIVSNFTRAQRCALKVVEVILEYKEIGIERLVDILCNLDYNKTATLDSVGLLFSNLTQISLMRYELMKKDQCLFQRLLPFTEFKRSHLRRGGIVGALKNCCFETEYHDWLMGDEVDILPHLLLPLAGPEEFDADVMDKLPDDLQYLPPEKTREEDPNIRKILVEAIIQLCSTKKWRLYIKEKNTYVIMRELHMWEKDPNTSVTIQALIDILIGDEPEEGMEELHSVDIPEDIHKEIDIQKEQFLKEVEKEFASKS